MPAKTNNYLLLKIILSLIMLFLNHNKLSREIEKSIRPQRIAFSRNLVNLSAGAIILTFTFVKLLEGRVLCSVWALKIAWIMFGVSILFGLIIRVLLLNADLFWKYGADTLEDINKKLSQIPRSRSRKKGDDAGQSLLKFFWFSERASYVEAIQFITFLMGIGLLISFMLLNF